MCTWEACTAPGCACAAGVQAAGELRRSVRMRTAATARCMIARVALGLLMPVDLTGSGAPHRKRRPSSRR